MKKSFTKYIPYVFYFLSFLGIIIELKWAEKVNGFWLIYAPFMIGLILHMKSNKTDIKHRKIALGLIAISLFFALVALFFALVALMF